MKLKLDANGHVVVSDGKPVYVHDDGKEAAFDAPGTRDTIARLNLEAKTHRERAEGHETKLKLFEGIDDPERARKALATVQNLDDKKLVDAGEVERVKGEAIKATEEKYKPVRARNEELERELYEEKVGGAFARSQYVREKLGIPYDLVQAKFGGQFKLEDKKVVGYGLDGNKIYSRSKPGELASFDEAMEAIVDQYPNKEHILKGNDATGSGARQTNRSKAPVIPEGSNTPAFNPVERMKRSRREQQQR